MTRTRRIILFIVIAFVLYTVVTRPTLAGNYVQEAISFLASAVQSVFTFFRSILN